MDIRASIDAPYLLQPIERVLIPTGLYIELPIGLRPKFVLEVVLAIKGVTVLNTPGTIDDDYKGELK